MIDHILVPLDGSDVAERILPHIAFLAKGLACPVTLLHIVDSAIFSHVPETVLDAQVALLIEQEKAEAQKYLRHQQQWLEQRGVVAASETVTGPPAATIAAVANARAASLIAMSTHGRSGIDRLFPGSVAGNVLQTATSPLLLYHPREYPADTEAQLEHIILPLDGSPFSEEAVPVAIDIAKRLSVPVTVIRALPTSALAFSDPFAMGAGDYAAMILEGITDTATAYLKDKVAELRSAGVKASHTLLLQGDVAGQIIDLVARTRSPLTVMSTHGRSGVGRLLLGSVADRVVRTSRTPVLLVHPAAK